MTLALRPGVELSYRVGVSSPRGFMAVGEDVRVLGIDPGTRLCGWGLVDRIGSRIVHVDNGVLCLPEKAHLSVRLAKLAHELDAVIAQFRPGAVAVEGVFQHRNVRSALTLAHARGVALARAGHHGLSVGEYTPQQIKKAVTGSGRGAKEQVQQMVVLRLGLNEPPQPDAADAVAVAMCHAQHGVETQRETVSGLPKFKVSRNKAAKGLAALVEQQMRERQ